MKNSHSRTARVGIAGVAALLLAGAGALVAAPAQAASPAYQMLAEGCTDGARTGDWDFGQWEKVANGSVKLSVLPDMQVEYAATPGVITRATLPLVASTTTNAEGKVIVHISGIPNTLSKVLAIVVGDGAVMGVMGTFTNDCTPVVPVVVTPTPEPTPTTPTVPVVVTPTPEPTPTTPVVAPPTTPTTTTPTVPAVVTPTTTTPTVPAVVTPATPTTPATTPVVTTVPAIMTPTTNPAALPLSDDEASAAGSSLASTGGPDVTPLAIGAVLALIGGITATAFARRNARRGTTTI